jgi:hypothetical protein
VSKSNMMSPRLFLHKTSTKAAVSASAFLQQHRDWLMTGEIADLARPILFRLDCGTVMPTPALQEIAAACMGHLMAVAALQIEQSIEKAEETKSSKAWTVSVFDETGKIAVRLSDEGEAQELTKSFDLASAADRWADLRLFEGAAGWYAVITHSSLKVETIVQRDDALARILRTKLSPVCRGGSRSNQKLSFGVKVKEDRSQFSRG